MSWRNVSSGWVPESNGWLTKESDEILLYSLSALAQGRDVWYGAGVHPAIEGLATGEEMMPSYVTHPYIDKHPGYRGGRAIIVGTNFPVSSVAIYILRHGMLPEELIRRFPHLTLAQVYDALSYYYDHQAEIDTEIQRNLGEDADAAQLS